MHDALLRCSFVAKLRHNSNYRPARSAPSPQQLFSAGRSALRLHALASYARHQCAAAEGGSSGGGGQGGSGDWFGRWWQPEGIATVDPLLINPIACFATLHTSLLQVQEMVGVPWE